MHDNCAGNFNNGAQMLEKVRQMGFSEGALPMPLRIECQCGQHFEMTCFEDACDACGMIYAVTPCHAFDADNVMPSGQYREKNKA